MSLGQKIGEVYQFPSGVVPSVGAGGPAIFGGTLNTSSVFKLKPPVPEKSGGDVNYYVVDVKQPKRFAPYTAECEDIIEALGMTFAEGCAFKAIWRSCAARTLGKEKAGGSSVYDAEKIVYYGNRILAQRKNVKV